MSNPVPVHAYRCNTPWITVLDLLAMLQAQDIGNNDRIHIRIAGRMFNIGSVMVLAKRGSDEPVPEGDDNENLLVIDLGNDVTEHYAHAMSTWPAPPDPSLLVWEEDD